ncbi:hypothetical protein [Leptospira broomii]|uniref:hypothetical protein n=1 Tax=Leptospira broomii TaxID=301541 RepID=UPI0012EC4343|nr:hypothetical protein [Leptospira broomii]
MAFKDIEIKELFYKAFPTLFRYSIIVEDLKNKEYWNSVSEYGLEVPKSWLIFVFEALESISLLVSDLEDPPYICQIKEKYQTLRIYLKEMQPLDFTMSEQIENIIQKTNDKLLQLNLREEYIK